MRSAPNCARLGPTNARLAGWSDLAAGAPAIADAGRGVLYRRGDGEGLLATVRGDAPPRIHPVNVGGVDGGLYVFLLDSAKRRDLAEDGRFALHGYQDPAEPTEFSVRGRARLIEPGELRDRVAAGWFFEVDDSYWLFELGIDSAILGERVPTSGRRATPAGRRPEAEARRARRTCPYRITLPARNGKFWPLPSPVQARPEPT